MLSALPIFGQSQLYLDGSQLKHFEALRSTSCVRYGTWQMNVVLWQALRMMRRTGDRIHGSRVVHPHRSQIASAIHQNFTDESDSSMGVWILLRHIRTIFFSNPFWCYESHKNEHESIISCRTPVWLKTAFAVLVQEGGGIGARLVRGKGK